VAGRAGPPRGHGPTAVLRHAACPRRIFAERLPATAARYARRTTRAAAALELLGFALGGRAGARLAADLGLASAPGTVLAHVRAAAPPAPATPRVLGVDDWALRRGQRYGTALVDLERRRVVDLLPDREAATFAAWLQAHPGVEIISRDRGGTYAEGARLGAPDAIQVADRFHLVHNLMAALERACVRHPGALRAAAEATGLVAPPAPQRREAGRVRRYSELPSDRPGPTKAEQRLADNRARRLAQYERVTALASLGRPKKRIARELGLSRGTVIARLAAGRFPERAERRWRLPTLTAPYAAEIAACYDAGCENAAELARALRARGYRGTDATVRRALAALRAARPRTAPGGVAAPPAVPVPAPRQVAWLLRKPDAQLTSDERAYLAALGTACPALAEARALALRFTTMLRERDPNALRPWLAVARRRRAHGPRAARRRHAARLRRRPRRALLPLEQRPGRGTGAPAQADQAHDVRARGPAAPARSGAPRGLSTPTSPSGRST
jgi:transposase